MVDENDGYAPGSIFDGSPALEVYSKIVEETTPEGLRLERNCEKCLKRMGILIPWSELYVVANGRWPQKYGMSEWQRSERYRKLFPTIHCRCDSLLLVGFTPESAKAVCGKALASGVIDDVQMRQINQLNAMFKSGK